MERDIQREKKLRKVKISSNADNWKEIKNILGLGKDKLLYPDLVRSDGKEKIKEKNQII